MSRTGVSVIAIAAAEGRLLALDFGERVARMETELAARYGGAHLVRRRDPFGVSRHIVVADTEDERRLHLSNWNPQLARCLLQVPLVHVPGHQRGDPLRAHVHQTVLVGRWGRKVV